MKQLLLVLSILAGGVGLAGALASVSPRAQTVGGCHCPPPQYVRSSSSLTLAGTEDLVELDTDSGNAVTVTLPASPAALSRVEVWLGNQPGLPGGTATIDPNGQAVTFAPGIADLLLDQANEGRVLLFVKPTAAGAGYWRASGL